MIGTVWTGSTTHKARWLMSEARTLAGTDSQLCGQRRHTLWPWRRRTKLCGSTNRGVAPPTHRAVKHIQLGLHHGIHDDTNTTHGHRSDRNNDNKHHTEVGGLLTLPVQNMRSRAASVCTKRTVRAVRQVTRPVLQTRHTAGLRGNPNLVTGRPAARWVFRSFLRCI